MVAPCFSGDKSSVLPLRRRAGKSSSRDVASQHFEQAVNRPVSSAKADADRQNAIEPVVFRSRGLEERRNAKVIARRIDRLAAVYPRQGVGRPMPNPLIRHADQRFVVGLEDQADIEGEGTVAADRLPIAAPVEDLA